MSGLAIRVGPACRLIGYRGQAGTLDFDVTGGRLALTPESLEGLCGVPGLPPAFAAPACAWITQATTWPMS